MVMPPPLPPIVLAFAVASVKLYEPELPLMLMPVDVPLVCTLPLKVIVFVLLEAMVTTFAALACVIAPPHVTVPLVPVTLNVEPVAPVSVPAVAPHVPVTALRFTPFVPPLEVTLAKV